MPRRDGRPLRPACTGRGQQPRRGAAPRSGGGVQPRHGVELHDPRAGACRGGPCARSCAPRPSSWGGGARRRRAATTSQGRWYSMPSECWCACVPRIRWTTARLFVSSSQVSHKELTCDDLHVKSSPLFLTCEVMTRVVRLSGSFDFISSILLLDKFAQSKYGRGHTCASRAHE
ncbi:hypothetical protein T492DRAFT_488309 [Pavlovales sp. CCMP2436]|nr:hypothetical protein T492DRAFT_488309 [Pavlovales sp. CCMP2436]